MPVKKNRAKKKPQEEKTMNTMLEEMLRKTVKNTREEIAQNKETPVEIIGEDKELLTFDDFKTKKFFDVNKDIASWTNRDFTSYIFLLYRERYGGNCEMRFLNVVTYIGNIKEALREANGSVDNSTLKDYIAFFFDRHADYFIRKKQIKFFIACMKNNVPILAFLSKYTPNKKIAQRKATTKETAKTEVKFSTERSEVELETKTQFPEKSEKVYDLFHEVENSYLLSMEKMLIKYGLYVAVDFLFCAKKLPADKIVEKIISSLTKLNNAKIVDKVVIATKNMKYQLKETGVKNEVLKVAKEKGITL